MITLWIVIAAISIGAIWEDIEREVSYLIRVDSEAYLRYDD